MKLEEYYQILNEGNLESLDNDIYFDYQGEGYNKVEFKSVNPLKECKNFFSVLKHQDHNYMFHFYQFEQNEQKYKGMDLLILEDGTIKDHYLVTQELNDPAELIVKNSCKTTIEGKRTKEFILKFWEGTDVTYAENYLEHSGFVEEIEYQNIIEVHYVHNFIVMLCDAKIAGKYGTIADLYCVENDMFIEHWDCFSVDLNQPPEL